MDIDIDPDTGIHTTGGSSQDVPTISEEIAHADGDTGVPLVTEFTRLYQQLKEVCLENRDTSIQRNIELLNSEFAQLKTENSKDHSLLFEKMDGLRKICEKIYDSRESDTAAEKSPEMTSHMEPYEAEFKSDHRGKITAVTIYLGEQLGAGGFGEVYKIELPEALYAAKFFTEQSIKQQPERLSKEMIILKKCNHKNVVKYVASCQIPKRSSSPVLIMELMETSFQKYFTNTVFTASNPEPTLDCTVQILKQVADGLNYLHTKCEPNIIHRDLTANNVLLNQNAVSPGFTAKISDFGQSRFVESMESVVSMTRLQAPRYYLAPEADSSKPRYNEKVDIFSFGHMALVSCIRKIIKELPDIRLEGGMSLTEIQRREEYFEDLREVIQNEKYHGLEALIKQCLNLKHNDRPTAEELIEKLSQIPKCHDQPRDFSGHSGFVNAESLLSPATPCDYN